MSLTNKELKRPYQVQKRRGRCQSTIVCKRQYSPKESETTYVGGQGVFNSNIHSI